MHTQSGRIRWPDWSKVCYLNSPTPTPPQRSRDKYHLLKSSLNSYTPATAIWAADIWKTDYSSVPKKTYCAVWFGHRWQSEIHHIQMFPVQTTLDYCHIFKGETEEKSRQRGSFTLATALIRFLTFLRKTASIPTFFSSIEWKLPIEALSYDNKKIHFL